MSDRTSVTKPYVITCRAIAEELGERGPITVDDVLTEAAKRKALNDAPDNRLWYGTIFPGKKWVRVGTKPSQRPETHARALAVWALRTWLENSPANGTSLYTSAFDTIRIYSEFMKDNKKAKKQDLTWYLGTERLSPTIDLTKPLYGIKIKTFDGVGALLVKKTKGGRK